MVSDSSASAQTVSLKSIIRQTADTVTLILDTWFTYRPGQSIQISLPGDSKKRYYSLSSSPTEEGFIAITVKCAPDHPVTAIIQQLKAGDIVHVEGPVGSFGLPDLLEGQFYFLAAGSGVTPVRSMMRYLMDRKAEVEKWLFYSVRTSADEIFKAEWDAWAAADPTFHRILTVTRSTEPLEMASQGRLTEAIVGKHLSKMDGHFFLCGPQGFVKDMEHLLTTTFRIPVAKIRREQW